MGSVSVLRTLSMVFNLILIHIAISDGLLLNYIGVVLLRASRTTTHTSQVIRTYYVQLVLSTLFVLSLVYLLVCSFLNGFLTFTNFSKYLRQPLNWLRRIFLNFIPVLILLTMAAFALDLLILKLHYAPGRDLYHTAPENYKSCWLIFHFKFLNI